MNAATTSITKSLSRVPVVLPEVRIAVGPDEALTVTVDRQLYDLPREWAPLGRDAVARILDQITTHLGSAVRVEVTDGGTTFTDIAIPPGQPRRQPPEQDVAASYACAIAGSGFTPDEPVAVAVVVAHQVADIHGIARLRLPPYLLASRPGMVIFLGKTSGTIALSDGAA